MFTKDIKEWGYKYFTAIGSSSWMIPKYHPCTVVKINNSHISVRYENEIRTLRNIPTRMIPATTAGKVLYGENNEKV